MSLSFPLSFLVCQEGDIRLVGGADSNQGRVEICYLNTWGSVCDDGWGQVDAQVACRQLGFDFNGKFLSFPLASFMIMCLY